MDYWKYTFTVQPVQPGSDILISCLAALEFESFVETKEGFEAYIPSMAADAADEEIAQLIFPEIQYQFKKEHIVQENWNETWEKNFHPVDVEHYCYIRAPFHAASTHHEMEVVIEPKMSFGTGHHDTTWMMTRALFQIPLKDQEVIDMGCGTGVLAIVAAKKGAKTIHAIDIDEWSYLNTVENAEKNGVHLLAAQGDASLLAGKKANVFLANINRNILFHDMQSYVTCLLPNGRILFSGFFETDATDIISKGESLGLKHDKTETRNTWALVQMHLPA